jgi:hypothetical protein
MFGRGSWAVFGIKAETQQMFEAALASTSAQVVVHSQSAAVDSAKLQGTPTYGVNPFDKPRGDEAEVPVIGSTEDFRLGPQQFGLWFCLNEYEDVTDPKSKQEQQAYELSEKPFKFLKKDEKKQVEAAVKASAVASRKQFPVLIDFIGERVYAFTTNEEEIGLVRQFLEDLGCSTFHMGWNFGSYDWPQKFLKAVWETNKFRSAMQSRADDLRRFNADEVEKNDDKMLETIMSGFFSMSELETGQWAGLTTPSKIKLFPGTDASTESSVSSAFTIASQFEDTATITSSAVVIQHLDSYVNKKDEEKQKRTDLLTIDVNDKVNISDAGAAALRGFDLPQYKRDMKAHAKDRGSLGIRDYWFEWLIAMKNGIEIFADNVRETLKVDRNLGLVAYQYEQEENVPTAPELE